MENFRVPEDVPIESPLVSQALDGVQAQVEESNRATRRQLQRLDEVAAVQRQQLYNRRRGVLEASDDGKYSSSFVYDETCTLLTLLPTQTCCQCSNKILKLPPKRFLLPAKLHKIISTQKSYRKSYCNSFRILISMRLFRR